MLKPSLKLLGILYFLVSNYTGLCQNEFSKWYFGDKAAIDFISGSPVVLTNSKIQGLDNTCSIADSAGNLLFYYDGIQVYNKNHQAMSNGGSLGANESSGHVALAVRKPGTGKIYYIITVLGYGGSTGLCYSIVDMSGNGGLGSVTSKAQTIKAPVTERIILAKHSNGHDIWIIAHEWNSNQWLAYPLTNSGIGNPVSTAIGANISSSNFENAAGNMDITLDYSRIAYAVYGLNLLEILDFNASNGKFSNLISMSGLTRAWTVQFSPSGAKLYFAQWTYDKVYQYDLSSYTLTDIQNSKTTIGTCTGPDPSYKTGYMMLAPDKKIYIGKYQSKFLSVIKDPDASGTNCNFVDDGIDLSPGKSMVGLPNKTFDILPCKLAKPFIGRDTSICKNEKIVLKDTVKNVSTYLWSTKETSSTITISDTGLYWLEIGNGQCKNRDSIHVKYKSGKAPSLGKDTFICEGVEMLLVAKQNATQYLWSTSEKTKTIRVSQPGKYWLQIIDNGCTMSDTININLDNMLKPNLGKDTIACEGKSIDLIGFTPNSQSYTWNNNSTNITETVSKSGTYILTITDYKCTLSDTIQVSFIPYPLVNLGKDTGFCGNIHLTLDAGNPGLNKIWNTNATTQTIPAVLHGIYWVQVNNRGCITRDSILIKKLPGPNVDLGKDTAFCVSFTKTLDAKNPGMNYLWNDASTNQTLVINSAGKYWVQVSDYSGCIMSDTFVFSDSSFTFRFGNDTTLCFGESLNLKTIPGNYSYLWQSGDQTDSFLVNSKGTYKVKISNAVCQISDSIIIDFLPPIDFKLQNDTSLCEGEDVNLIVQGPNGFKEYLWQPGNISTQNLLIQKEGKYFLKVTDLNDCSAIDSITIEQNCPLLMWVPTIFSPAGNYSNSKFGVVYTGPPIIYFEMLIYNRWGELIFKSHNVNAFWDGTYMEKPCQLGMYLCIINLKAGYKKEVSKANYKGMFYLNR
jgi:gliding motility-associated-like protein